MQQEERDFLRETADEIQTRVYALENQVRKETGDHSWTSGRTTEPNWYTDVGTSTVWGTAQCLTTDQLHLLIQRQNRRPMVDQSVETDEGQCGSSDQAAGPSDDLVVVEMTRN